MRLRALEKLFLSYLVLISLVVLALVLGADFLLRSHLTRVVEQELRRELMLHVRLYEAAGGAAPDSVADLLGELTGHRVTVVGRDGVVLGESSRDGAGLAAMTNHADRPEVRAALEGRVGEAVRRSETVGADHLYVAAPTRRGEVLRAAVPLQEVDAAVARAQRGILGVGAAALGLAALFSLGFSVAVTRPLRRLQGAAGAMAGGDMRVRLRERRGDELGDLADALDSMADELQRRLAQLEGERAEMQALIDSMEEGVLALDPDGTVRRANPAARRIFGFAGDGVPDVESISRRKEFLRPVRAALKGTTAPPQELNDRGRSLLVTAQPLPHGGAVVVILDLSDLRRLEGVRRDFVANASHELKTPLTAIRGYSETLLDPELPPELVRRFAGVVHANSERLQRIVDHLLDLTRIESGGWPVQPAAVWVREAAEDAWRAQGRAPEERRVELQVDTGPGAEQVWADPSCLHQVLSNLFSNALRYAPRGGSVEVAAAPAQAAGWIEVRVRDTGSGIPAAHLPRIFERFYRVDPARSREEGGTGLGLAIVKHIVEAHGGRITAESRVGDGTTMRFTLPAVSPDPS